MPLRFLPAPRFTPGQAVGCVDDHFYLLKMQNPAIQTPVNGPVYHVRENHLTRGAEEKGWGITLVEIDNSALVPEGTAEPNFAQRRFAPIEEMPALALSVTQEEPAELVEA